MIKTTQFFLNNNPLFIQYEINQFLMIDYTLLDLQLSYFIIFKKEYFKISINYQISFMANDTSILNGYHICTFHP